MDEQIIKFASMTRRGVQRVQVRSAVNPLLWLCATMTPACFTFAYFFRAESTLKYLLIALGALPVLCACFISIYFSLWKPEKMQSEDYQLRYESLQLLKQKNAKSINVQTLKAITNPRTPKLLEAEDDER